MVLRISRSNPGMEMHTSNPSPQEAEAGGSPSVQGEPTLQSKARTAMLLHHNNNNNHNDDNDMTTENVEALSLYFFNSRICIIF